MNRLRFLSAACAILFLALPACAQPYDAPEVIDQVWSGHHVDFGLVSSDNRIYAGYYDAKRQLTIASRPKSGGKWTYRKLDTHLGWDSHNYVTLALDNKGRLHVAANMHASPLTYYVSAPGGDIATLTRVHTLVERSTETHITYPVFLHDPNGRLVFKYRLGTSGDGDEIYDVLDDATGQWSHLLPAPLVDGQGKYSAYFQGPILGPDKRYHLAWVWRDSPDAATNHDLSYAQSPDLVHWYKADGTPLKLPITLGTADIVDPVPPRGGMVNGNTIIGFDDQGHALITYFKYDRDGNTQVYLARSDNGRWQVHRITDWDFRYDFGGKGAFSPDLVVHGAESEGDGYLRIPIAREHRAADVIVRSDDLSVAADYAPRTRRANPAAAYPVPDGMGLATEADDGCDCQIAWATRGANRDRPYKTQTAPTDLVLLPQGSNLSSD